MKSFKEHTRVKCQLGSCRKSLITFRVSAGSEPNASTVSPSRLRLWWATWLLVLLSLVTVSSFQAGSNVGYRDFSYGKGSVSPTRSKPESKLWWNNGSWWASMLGSSGPHYIYRLDLARQSWVKTGTALDDRRGSKADALWDDATQKLFVASHQFTSTGMPTSTRSDWGRLYRYSYDSASKAYSLDAGFPVTVTRGTEEALTVAQDSVGRLWVTYVESGKVMVNRSVNNDLDWSQPPFVLPVKKSESVNVSSDDISAVVAFGGDKIGIMWGNQRTSKMYFAVHRDVDAANVWQAEETALPGPNCTGACADDHINLKSLQVGSDGRVYAAIKTSLKAANSPLIMLLVRDPNGAQWSSSAFGRVQDDHTRPIVLLDEQHGRIYMFATAPQGGGAIYYKTSDINNITFPLGLGTPFIQSSTDLTINNATSTKQNLNGSTGLVVLASDGNTRFYLHNYIQLK
jgi:hypothetical protein